MMALEKSLKRLWVHPLRPCQQCRRSIRTTGQQGPLQSATTSFADILQNAQNNAQSRPTSEHGEISSSTAAIPPTSGTPSVRTNSAFDLARSAVQESQARNKRAQNAIDMQQNVLRKDMEWQMPRKWKPGDVYSPRDLGGGEMAKWKKWRRKTNVKYDVMDQLGINPLNLWKNFSVMSEYMSEMGKIKHRNETGLRPVNQRKIAKAIRRAVGIGIMPGVHRHPEIIRLELQNKLPRG